MSNMHLPGPGGVPGLPVLLLVTATSVMAAHSQAWASAVATAAAVYGVFTEHHNRRS